jgi:aminocarboxymuconate-semialdehyde decarboxylase
MYGSDYPCWSPADALRFFGEIGFSDEIQQKILGGNARRILRLDEPALEPVLAHA